MAQYTDTRVTLRGGPDAIREILNDRWGRVAIDTTQKYGPTSGKFQSVTSVRTSKADLSYLRYVPKYQRDAVKRQLRLRKMVERYHRRTNPNPCVLVKSETVQSGAKHIMVKSGNTFYPVAALHGSASGWAYTSRYGPPSVYGVIGKYEQNYIDNAVLKGYAKANSSKMPTLVYLGELGETLRMLRKPFSGIRKLMTSLKSKARVRIRREFQTHAEAVMDQWLEYRYGILPLMAQVDEICEAFATRMVLGYPIQISRDGLSSLSVTRTQVPSHKVSPTYFYGYASILEETRIGAFASIAHALQIDEEKFFGLRPRDVLPAAWELVPYSFVVDWFYNLGDWLQAIQPNPKLQVKSVSISLKRSVKREIHVLHVGYGVNRVGGVATDCKTTVVSERLDRIINPTKPVFPVSNPNFFNYLRVLDSIALSYGQLKRAF